MTREEMEKYINAPLCKELYDKFKIIYDKGYQDCKKEIKNYTSATINDYQKTLIEIYNEINESENAVCYLTSYDNDVILAAIKALGQQSCEDCISRQAVLDIDFNRICLTTTKPAEMIRDRINNLLSVTPQEKTGHWIVAESGNYNGKWSCRFCDNCRYYYTRDWEEMNYCPNCGARMSEVSE